MFHKILTAVLAAVVLVEGAYILLRRHPANRFMLQGNYHYVNEGYSSLVGGLRHGDRSALQERIRCPD